MNGTLTLSDTKEHLLVESSTGLTSGREYPEKDWPVRQVPGSVVGDAAREQSFRECASQIDSYRFLPQDWDTYGGLPASDAPLAFAANLVEELRWLPEVFPPYVCPISTGVYLEWRSGEANLYFEVDEDSVLFVMEEGGLVIERGEDTTFDVGQAIELVKMFHRGPI